MGVSYQPPAAAVAPGKILRRVYRYLGFDPELLRWGEELCWCYCDPSVPWSLRGCGDTGFCLDHFSGMSFPSVPSKQALANREYSGTPRKNKALASTFGSASMASARSSAA